MEERDVPPTKEEGTLHGKSKLLEILFHWPLLPEQKLEMVRRFEERRELALHLGFTDV